MSARSTAYSLTRLDGVMRCPVQLHQPSHSVLPVSPAPYTWSRTRSPTSYIVLSCYVHAYPTQPKLLLHRTARFPRNEPVLRPLAPVCCVRNVPNSVRWACHRSLLSSLPPLSVPKPSRVQMFRGNPSTDPFYVDGTPTASWSVSAHDFNLARQNTRNFRKWPFSDRRRRGETSCRWQ